MKKRYYFYAFILSFLISAIVIIPYIIEGDGIFTLWGDFNVQQIPFGIYMNKMIKSGNIIYDWCNQLGNSFLESFSFYNLGSIFYWITLLFDADFYPYLVGPMLIFKFGIAGLTSFAYIQTFCRNKKYALLGSILYSFSGFQVTSIVFHFIDSIALFPLLLLTLDNLLIKNKKGLFCLSLALLAITNYFFFVGQCVFLFIYFICNICSKRYIIDWKKFFYLVIEVIIGLLLSSFILFPSLLNIFTNSRMNLVWDFKSMFLYENLLYYIDILKSIIMPSDLMFSRTFFDKYNYMSVEQWLPFVGIILVIPFIKKNRKSFLSYIIKVLFVFMFVPILNSSFVGFNVQYYARWFYMLTLMLSICSVLSLENNYKIKSGVIFWIFLVVLFIILIFLQYFISKDKIILNYSIFYINIFITVLCFILFTLLYRVKSSNLKFYLTFVGVILFSLISFDNIIYCSRLYTVINDVDSNYKEDYYKNYLNINNIINLDYDNDYRVHNLYFDNSNYLMNKQTISSFISVIDENTINFYNTIAKEKYKDYYLGSLTFEENQYYIKSFLSTKYYIVRKIKMDVNSTENLVFVNDYSDEFSLDNTFDIIYKNDDFVVYENKYFLNLGLLYDEYTFIDHFNELDLEDKNSAYLKSIILEDDLITKYEGYLKEINKKSLSKNSFEDFKKDYNHKKKLGTTDFSLTDEGFKINVDSRKNAVLLLTIPFDDAWHAYINNKEIDIDKVSNGFMAIKVNDGKTDIDFKYRLKGGTTGKFMSICGCICYSFLIIFNSRKKEFN